MVLLIPVILESLMRPVVIQFSEPHHWCGLEDRVIAHSSRDTPFLVTSDKGTLLVMLISEKGGQTEPQFFNLQLVLCNRFPLNPVQDASY